MASLSRNKVCHSERSEEYLPVCTTVVLACSAAGPNQRFHRQPSRSLKPQLHIRIRAHPDHRQPRQPVFAIDSLTSPRMFLRRQQPCRRRDLSSGNFPPNRARCHLHLRIVPNAFRLPHIASRHHVKLSVIFAEPNRRCYADAVLAKRRKRNIFLPANGIWNLASHSVIVNGEAESRDKPSQALPRRLLVLPCVPPCPLWLRIQDMTANHCSRRRICVTSLTCVNGCAIVFSAARKSLPSRLTSRLLHPCSPHISTPNNRPPIPTQNPLPEKKAAGKPPPAPPASLSRRRNPGHVPAVVPFARLPLRPLMLCPATHRPRILHPPKFPTRSLTPSTLPHPATPRNALVAAVVAADAVEAEAVAANKPLLKPSLPKGSRPRFRQKPTTLRNSPSPHPPLRPQRPGHPQPQPSRNVLPKAS